MVGKTCDGPINNVEMVPEFFFHNFCKSCEYSEVLDPHTLVQLCTELKCSWVWQEVRSNIFEFSYVLKPSTCGSDKVLNPTFFYLAIR